MKLLLTKIIIVTGLILLCSSIGFSDEQIVVTGRLNQYNPEGLVGIGGKVYRLCLFVEVFNKKGERIMREDLGAAKVVKATFKEGCISEVEVLEFWH